MGGFASLFIWRLFMIPAVIAGIASVASAAMASKSGGSKPSVEQTSGIMSPMSGNQPNTEIQDPVSVSGSQSGEFAKDMAQDAFKTGMSAVLGHGISSAMSPSASQQGRDQRDYLAAAFPEMNPWERAGASATQQGVQMAQNKQAMQLQAQQIQGAKDVARINGDTQRDVANINAGASGYSADSSSAASRYGSDISSQNVDKQIASVSKKINAETKLILEQAKTEAEAKTGIMRLYKDVKHLGEDVAGEGSTDLKTPSSGEKNPNINSRGVVKGSLGDRLSKQLDDWKEQAFDYIDKKFGRENAKGVQSQYDAGFADENPYVKSLNK